MKRSTIWLAVIGVMSALSVSSGQLSIAHRISEGFSLPSVADVRTLARMPETAGGDLFLAGNFESIAGVPCANFARHDGRSFSPLADALAPFPGTTKWPMTVFDDGQGPRLYAAGSTVVGAGIYRYDGATWQKVGADIGGDPRRLVVADDGTGEKLYALNVATVGGTSIASRIVRLEGGQWVPFGTAIPGAEHSIVEALVAFDEGSGPKINVGLSAEPVAIYPHFYGVFVWSGTQWSQRGSLITTPSLNLGVADLAVADLDGTERLYVGGTFILPSGNHLARWMGNAWVAVPGSFGVNDLEAATHAGVNVLYVGGIGGSTIPFPTTAVRRWNGAAWSTVGATTTTGTTTDICARPNGASDEIFVSGLTKIGDVWVDGVASFDGALWHTFAPYSPTQGLDAEVLATAIFDAGQGSSLHIGGRFAKAGGTSIGRVARWDATNWQSLAIPGPSGTANSFVAALQPFTSGGESRLVCAGSFPTFSGGSASIAQWNGTVWSPLGVGLQNQSTSAGATGWAMTVFDDGTGPALYVAGQFEKAGGIPCSMIARWNGMTWSSVGGGIGTNVQTEGVYALAVFDDGQGPKLYAGGKFASAGGQAAASLASWNGSSWMPVSTGVTGAGGAVFALKVLDDGTGPALYVGGDFTTIGGVAAKSIARFDGTNFSALGSGLTGGNWGGVVASMAAYDDGGGPAIWVGGVFGEAGGIPAVSIARWKSGAWSNSGSGLSRGAQYAIADTLISWTFADGPSLFIGGWFNSIDGVPSANFARYEPEMPLAPNLWLVDPAAAGTVGLGIGGPFDVLRVQGVAGLGHAVKLSSGEIATITAANPPTNPDPAGFVIFLSLAIAQPSDVVTLPYTTIQTSFVFPPFDPGNPLLFTFADSLGTGLTSLVGAHAAPWSFTSPPAVAPLEFTLQGVIADQSQMYGLAVTNAVAVAVVP